MGGVLTGGREACVACIPKFKPLACLVAEISAKKSFPIVTVSQGPTIGFRCEPAVSTDWATVARSYRQMQKLGCFRLSLCFI